MPLHKHIVPNEATHIWIWETTESNEALLAQACNLGWRLELTDIASEQRRREIIVTHLLMSLAGISAIYHEENGRPYCREYASISLSHSKQWVVLATHQSSPIGVDIECGTDKVLRVASRFMSERELDYLPKNLPTMLIAWCAKEAAYKIIGQQATGFRATLCIHPFSAEENGVVSVEHVPTAQQLTLHYQAYLLHYMLVYGFKEG